MTNKTTTLSFDEAEDMILTLRKAKRLAIKHGMTMQEINHIMRIEHMLTVLTTINIEEKS